MGRFFLPKGGQVQAQGPSLNTRQGFVCVVLALLRSGFARYRGHGVPVRAAQCGDVF